MFKDIFGFLFFPSKVALALKEKDDKHKNKIFFFMMILFWLSLVLLPVIKGSSLIGLSFWLNFYTKILLYSILPVWAIIIWALIVATILYFVLKIFKWNANINDILGIIWLWTVPIFIFSVLYIFLSFSVLESILTNSPSFFLNSIFLEIFSLIFKFWAWIIFTIWISRVSWFKGNILSYVVVIILLFLSVFKLYPLLKKDTNYEEKNDISFNYEVLEKNIDEESNIPMEWLEFWRDGILDEELKDIKDENNNIIKLWNKVEARKSLIMAKQILQKMENWNESINNIEKYIMELDDTDLIKYFNNEKELNLDDFDTKESLDFFEISLENEIHLRSSINKIYE